MTPDPTIWSTRWIQTIPPVEESLFSLLSKWISLAVVSAVVSVVVSVAVVSAVVAESVVVFDDAASASDHRL